MLREDVFKRLAIALVVFAAFLAVYVWQEGWVLFPNTSHWWWWASATWLWGIDIGMRHERQSRREHLRILLDQVRRQHGDNPTVYSSEVSYPNTPAEKKR